jgi:hypothetical protein
MRPYCGWRKYSTAEYSTTNTQRALGPPIRSVKRAWVKLQRRNTAASFAGGGERHREGYPRALLGNQLYQCGLCAGHLRLTNRPELVRLSQPMPNYSSTCIAFLVYTCPCPRCGGGADPRFVQQTANDRPGSWMGSSSRSGLSPPPRPHYCFHALLAK